MGKSFCDKLKENVSTRERLCSVLWTLDLFSKNHLKCLLTSDKMFSQIFLSVDTSYH